MCGGVRHSDAASFIGLMAQHTSVCVRLGHTPARRQAFRLMSVRFGPESVSMDRNVQTLRPQPEIQGLG